MPIVTEIKKVIPDNKVYVLTDTDTVPYIEPYFSRAYLDFNDDRELGYLSLNKGEAAIQFDRKLRQLNFDVNSNGELIVIGDDAANYGINEKGELIYNSQSGGIGVMIIEYDFIVG